MLDTIDLGFTSDGLGVWVCKRRDTEGVLLSVVDQMLSTICESSRTKMMSSLWDQLTKGVSCPNKNIANNMLSIHAIFFGDMAEDSSRGARMLPCRLLPVKGLGDQCKTCIYSLILELVQDLLWRRSDFLTNAVHPRVKDGSKILTLRHSADDLTTI